jgi:SAM-dependent methyltransferase
MASWYDHPHYFDLLFRDETELEVSFFQRAFEQHARGKVHRLLEPGCGSGRLVVALAARGYDVTGLDLSRPMLDYLEQRLRERKLDAHAVLGDMTAMKFRRKFDAAFCTFNTFRHLTRKGDAEKHLRSVAANLRRGGLYILGFHLIPLDADTECVERWKASEGQTRINGRLTVVDFDRKKGQELLHILITARKGTGKTERIESEFPLRIYTARQAKNLFRRVDDVLEISGVYDFDYDIDKPRQFDDELTDALFVLRRR